ncbi:MAG TPA: sigma-70 family RNA polymerase sigma factor [Polyangia bacterium]|nr:sigma-70 family RNA polymerase sigma factor [Polyangia bacterium]
MPHPHRTAERSNQAPFTHFFTHRAMLRAYLQAMLRDGDLVNDTLSDIAVEVARRWEVYDPSMPFGPWVRGIARRLALKRLRRRRRVEVGLPEDVLESLGVAMDQLGDAVALEGQKRQLRRCLEGLNERHRELVRLRYFEEERLDAIAEQSQRSMGALYVVFSRIHAALLRCMEKADARERS